MLRAPNLRVNEDGAVVMLYCGRNRLVRTHPTLREPKSLWQTDIALCQKRGDRFFAHPWRPRSDYSP